MDQLILPHIESAKQYINKNPIKIYKQMSLDDGLNYIKTMKKSRQSVLNDQRIQTKQMRHVLFENGYLFCCKCGLEGSHFVLEKNLKHEDDYPLILQLYGKDKQGNMISLTWDHIIPSSLNGNDTLENSQVMCRSCNLNKGDKITEADILFLKKENKFNKMVTDITKANKTLEVLFNKQNKHSIRRK